MPELAKLPTCPCLRSQAVLGPASMPQWKERKEGSDCARLSAHPGVLGYKPVSVK